ncbi:MAG: hypothetical protein BWY80_00943 [Firmicutes bacterium ADurb.Bin456]|nr:MAG: hypothetical protein BWY80_00943 [Firmicutes bacterium ADurb.Bin456]
MGNVRVYFVHVFPPFQVVQYRFYLVVYVLVRSAVCIYPQSFGHPNLWHMEGVQYIVPVFFPGLFRSYEVPDFLGGLYKFLFRGERYNFRHEFYIVL